MIVFCICAFVFVAAAVIASEYTRLRKSKKDRARALERMNGAREDAGFGGMGDGDHGGIREGASAGASGGRANAGSVHGRLRDAMSRAPFIGQLMRRDTKRNLKLAYESELARMLEVVALGMQAGLTFDRSFALYAHRFDTALAHACRERFDVWEQGLIARETGLRELIDVIDIPVFTRFATTVIRALRYGAPICDLLGDLAEQARKEHRARQQELVAKAPVKMLVPTGALILPAMLMLVIGPIVLDVVNSM
ncbi:MAG: type II secretion system F family protein [Coriobacteriales bacterium]|jgi:tight adherence protein C|nr:type II secretion system F family protein [Coriobacteriales bacterium]